MTYRLAHINDADQSFQIWKTNKLLFCGHIIQERYSTGGMGTIKFKRMSVKREKMQKEVAVAEMV